MGIVLLIGMTIAGALLVVAIGSTALDEAQQDSQMQVAEQSMQEVSSQFLELKAAGNGGKASFEIPDELGGDVSVQNTTTVRLEANGNQSCSTGPVGMGTVVYESSNQGVVGYEAGGVWRKQGESTWMVSSPDIEYRNGRLALQISDMSGFAAGSGEITAKVDEERSRLLSENISRSMYVNRTARELGNGVGPVAETCQPGSIENVTLSVQGSQFARAWYTFAQNNFDDRRVSVEEQSIVRAGDTVNITYLLGDRQDPEYRITEVTAPASTNDGTDMSMDVTVENVGDFNGTAPITLLNTTGGGPPAEFDSTKQTIPAGESETVTLTVDAADLNTGGNPVVDYTARIEVPDDEEEVRFVVGTGSPADLSIQPLTAPPDAELGDDRELDAVIENTGGMPASKTVQFFYAGEHMAERTVRVDDGDDERVTFDVPTTREGVIPLRVALKHQTDSDQDRSTTIEIGDLPDFELVSTSSPFQVTQNRPYEIDATVENDASNDGTRPIDIEVRNATTGATVYSERRSLSLNGYETDTITFRNDSGIATPGLYEYVVETDSDSETGTFRVGSIDEPFFVTVQTDTDRSVVQQNGDFNITGVIRNAGGQTGTQEVTVSFDGSEIASRSVTLDPGNGTDIGPIEQSLSGIAPGEYQYTVETDNTSATGQIQVVEEFDGDFDSGDSTIQINRSITARLTVLGTELSGIVEERQCEQDYSYWEGWHYDCEDVPSEIIRGPVEMAIYTDNDTAPDEYHRVWGDKDLNTPHTRQDQISGADYLSKEITVTATEESTTNVSVFAESFECGSWRDSGIDRNVSGYELDALACDESDPESRIAINQDENPSNLVIREDGERVPAYGQAGPEQRDVREILGDLITDDGYLQLDDDQMALFYELSEENADPDDAMDTNEDPDYNDAVVLFEVVAENHTATVPGRTDIVINDTRGPATVDPGYDESFEVKVWNRGGDTVDDSVEMAIDGSNAGSTDFSLAGRESKWVEIDIPSGLSSGTHGVEFSIGSDDNETAFRNLYVGEADGPYFLPNVESFEGTVPPGESAEIEALVTNVGDNESTQDVTATVVETYHGLSVSDVADPSQTWSDLHLGAGADDSKLFGFEASAEGTMRVRIATENASTAVNVTVMEPRLDVKRAIVGDQTYRDGDAIVSTNLESLTVDVGNPAEIPRSGDVELHMREDGAGSFEHIDTSDSITLNGNRTLVDLDLTGSNPLGPDLNNKTGVYEYELRSKADGEPGNDDVQRGEIQIVAADETNTTADADYISVDMNQIELG
ncbi:hypothetical protein BV210_02355 [Halorientalis sp. IM1011]|uniref:DUF7289 family protein n=1 Tax=Halorientalis sp. IM1011 TaxID=1932360 RepID=UPI00097CC807|nr:hypothetical protein [Halorientalis sp. IM1011]AQL41626.1 hypothetical protein BV210_02355 [Halorientalis sp. IM1011]